jgi:hypothetical protein
MPPPQRTNRAKEASGPEAAGAAGIRRASWAPVPVGSAPRTADSVSGFDESSAFMGLSFRTAEL